MLTQLTLAGKDALVRCLNSSNDADRQKAQAELKALIADDVRRIELYRAIQMYIFMLGSLVYISAWAYARLVEQHTVGDLYISIMFLSVITAVFAQSRVKSALESVTALDIPQAVGAFIDVFSWGGWMGAYDTRPMLIKMLPRLQASDTNLITLRQRKLLYAILSKNERIPWYNRYWKPELKIAILRALEQIGDAKAVPVVEKVARTTRNAEVRQAAEECLLFLQQRAEQTRLEQTLLRASTPATSDMLLRPTVSTVTTEPQQLLRASNTEGDGYKP